MISHDTSGNAKIVGKLSKAAIKRVLEVSVEIIMSGEMILIYKILDDTDKKENAENNDDKDKKTLEVRG